MALPRMRGINEAIAEIKAEDENSAITPHYLRKLVKSNAIPVVRAGSKYLVNMDALESYLQNPTQAEQSERSGTLKRVAE